MDPYTNPYGQKSANNTYINPYSPGASNSDISVDELLAIAQAQGGKVGQIATELSGGNKTMLSTIGKGFKNTFNEFVDVISMPGQVVAGMISPEFTVKEAIAENKRVSDAIFGDSNIFNKDGDPTTMQKIGDFIVRLPTDILTDPLTYLTFGASRTVGILGKMGFGSNSKVSLYKNAAEQLGVAIDDGDVISRALSDYGQEVLGYGKKYEEAIKSGTKTAGLSTKEAKQSLIQKGINKEILDMIENNTKTLLNETIDKKFDIDVAKRVISNIMEKSPALTKEFIDGGGMKYFGKTILEGQRIGALVSVIPGVKKLDYITQPFRQSVQAMFDSSLVKVGQDYVRVPEEMIRFKSNLQSLMERKNVDFVKNMDDVQRQFNLEKNELDILVNSLNTSTLPNDPRLDAAYYKMLGIKDSMIKQMQESGVNVAKMDNWVGLVTVPNDTKAFRGNTQFSKKFGAAQQAQNVAAIPLKTAEEIQAMPEVQDILSKIDPKQNADVIDNIKKSRSIEEVRDAIGRKRDEIVQNLQASGKTLDEAINDKSVKELNDLQSTVAKMETAGKLVGIKETAPLVIRNTDEEIKRIITESEDSLNRLNIKAEDFKKEISTLALRISDIQTAKILGNFDQILKNLPSGSRDNLKVIIQKIEDYVGRADIEKLKGAYANEQTFNTIEEAAKGIKELDYDDKLRMVQKVLKNEEMFQLDVEQINKNIKEVLNEKSKTKQTTKKEITKLSEEDMNKVKKLYEQSRAAKFALAGRDIDGNALSKLIEILKEEFVSNPNGVRGLLKSMLSKESKLNDVISLIDETKFQTRKQLSLLPEDVVFLEDNKGQIYKRVATTAQELRSHGIEGFDENLLTAWTVRGLQNIRQGLGKEFSEGLVRNFGRWADEAPESWVTMSSALVNDEAKNLARGFVRGDGVEMKFHPAVAKVFDDMVAGFGKQNDEIASFLKGYDKLQSYYKSYLTTLFPMFHGRNAISNVLLNFLDIGIKSLDPARHGMSADLIMKDRKINNLMRKAAGTGPEAQKAMEEIASINSTKMFTDRIGHEWTYGELRSVIRDNNIAFNPNLTGAIDVRNDRDELAKMFGIGETKKQRLSKMTNPLNADKFAPTQFGRGLGRVIEEQSRLINFMTNLIDTGDVSHATARTKQFLFDYQYGLTKFEKDVMRRIIPFYSFTRFNLELQAKMLMSAPGKIATEIKAVQSLGSFLNGEPMTEEERKLLPPWMANQLNIKRRKEDGTYEIISGFGTPIEQPFQQFSKSGLLGSLSPLIKIPVEKLTGYDLFRGKMTSDVIDAKAFRDAPQPIKNLIGYIEYEGKRKDGTTYTAHVSLRPEAMHTILSTPYSRFVSTYSSATDLDISKSMRTLQGLTGIRAYSYDEVLLQQRKEDEMIRAMEKLLKDAGIRGSFTRGYNRTNTTLIEN